MLDTILKCPACRTPPLFLRAPETGLTSQGCDVCGGQWIRWDDYWDWLEHAAAHGTPAAAPPADRPVPDNEWRAKLCPSCGRLLTRAKVGRGFHFQIERCAGCGGIWLEAGAWETLRAAGLHRGLHRVFSPAWQADVARRERQEGHEALLLRKLGADDLHEARRVRAWLDAHPRRRELFAVLLDHGADVMTGP
jgi:Zn-finger nucleic acid-binding protein